jgi:hypothetical protein
VSGSVQALKAGLVASLNVEWKTAIATQRISFGGEGTRCGSDDESEGGGDSAWAASFRLRRLGF